MPPPENEHFLEQQRPGRWLAVIVRTTTRDKGFVFAQLSASAEECFIHRSCVPPMIWRRLMDGDAISCLVSETSKGLRGHDITETDEPRDMAQIDEDTDEIARQLAQGEDDRGNQ